MVHSVIIIIVVTIIPSFWKMLLNKLVLIRRIKWMSEMNCFVEFSEIELIKEH